MPRPFASRWLLVGVLALAGSGLAAEPPEAGGPTALPQETTEAVPLANPGFEADWDGWLPRNAAAFALDAAARSGKACVRLNCGQATPYVPSLRQPLKDLGPGIYALRFWVRTRDLGGASKGDGARVSIEYLLQDGQRAWPSTSVFRGTGDWRQEELRVLIPPELKPGSAAISLHRYGGASGGQALFDDFALERIRPAPAEAYLLYPNYRGYLPDDGPAAVRLWVRANDAKATEPAGVEARRMGDDKPIATAHLGAGTREQVVELDASKWPLGRYEVEARLGSYRTPPYIVHKIAAEQRKSLAVWFDAHQVMHVAGKPVFPFGLYNTTRHFANGELDFDEEAARLKKMAEAPVNANTNYWWWPCGTAVRQRYLAEMQRHGLGYFDCVNNAFPPFPRTPCVAELVPEAAKLEKLDSQELVDAYLTRLAAAMRDLPAFHGWYVMDERGFDDVPRHFHQYRVLRRADPGHPTFGVSNLPLELPLWRDTLDVFGLDPYPLFNMKAGRPLSMVGEWTRAGMAATHGSRPVWMVIQFFQGWSTDRWPTAEELRTMSLMAIAEGARGLYYWSFGNRGLMSVANAQQQEDYWQRLVKVTKELKALEPALVAPDAPQAVKAVSDPRVRWRARLAGGRCHIFAYLPSEKFVADPAQAETVEVRFTLAGGQTATCRLRPDFAEYTTAPLGQAQ
ncbi:MAG TPA: hypothetical protein PLE19_10615 [Planctomycetota bacterium]|nr:hypothetical protein [Planctomycetota bacterium]HRR82358.1 hypothetical protein [Planctomycetota bacterium]HRT95436.1 hypothetical protein [Planctomycetota bacterium]